MTPTLPGLMLAMLLSTALLAGCSKPRPPDKERPVEPQATQMRDAMQAPLKEAREAEAKTHSAEEAQRKAIEAAGG